jgi:hypothetical protein
VDNDMAKTTERFSLRMLFTPARLLTLITGVLVTHLLFFVNTYAVNLMLWDQWDYEFLFADKNILHQFLHQHGAHRQGLAFVLDALLENATQWNTRSESFLIVGILIAACIAAILLKKALFRKIEYSDITIPLFFLTLVQADALLLFPNPSYGAFPLLLLILYTCSLLQKNILIRYALITVINALMIYSGYGIFIGIITPVLIAADLYRYRKSADTYNGIRITALSISLLLFGSFFLNYTFTTAAPCFASPLLFFWAYPFYISLMFTNVISGSVLIALALLPVGLLLLAYSLKIILTNGKKIFAEHPPLDPLYLITTIYLVFSLLFGLNAAIGRLCIGLLTGTQSRYTIFMIPVYLGLYFSVLQIKDSRIRKIGKVVFPIMAFLPYLLVHLPLSSLSTTTQVSTKKQAWADCYRQNENIAYCDKKSGLQIYDDPKRTNMEEKLQYLKKNKLNFFSQ